MDDDFFGFSFIEITISVCCLFLLFVFVLHSQNGGSFLYQSVFGSASASTSIGASAVLWLGSCAFETAVEEPLSGGDVWWCVFWKVGCRIWRVSVEHIYVCICIYNIYIYKCRYIYIYNPDLIFHRWICSKKVHQGPSSHQIIKSLHPSPQLIIGFVKQQDNSSESFGICKNKEFPQR